MKYSNKILVLFCLILSQTVFAKPIFIGDSLAYPLAKAYSQTHSTDARYKISSGLLSKKVLNWQGYVNTFDFSGYDVVYVMLGTNDLITTESINDYSHRVTNFIQAIKKTNQNIVWILPPSLKNERDNHLLENTRIAIINSLNENNINSLDMQDCLGKEFRLVKDGIKIRTVDGIHITNAGALIMIKELHNKATFL